MMNEEILPKELTNNIGRRGKWTVEEEKYTEQIIDDFDEGVLDVPEGTTLRTYLSRVLNCDPMRITKKYTGNLCIGKRTFSQKINCDKKYLALCHDRLNDLRHAWVSKLLLTEQWNNRKLNTSRNSYKPTYGEIMSSNDNIFNQLNPQTQRGEIENLVDHSVVSPSEECEEFCASPFPGDKVRSALLPYLQDSNEIERVMIWLQHCHKAVETMAAESVDSPDGSVMIIDDLIAVDELPVSTLYKILLSGSIATHFLLQSSVQAVLERQIVLNEHPNAEAVQPVDGSDGRMKESIGIDDESNHHATKRIKINSPRTAESQESHSLQYLQFRTQKKQQHALQQAQQLYTSVFPQGLPSHTRNSDDDDNTLNKRYTLEDCLATLQHRRVCLIQGPISATASNYQQVVHQQQFKAVESCIQSISPNKDLTLGCCKPLSANGFEHVVDQEEIERQLQVSLKQSINTIAQKAVAASSSAVSSQHPTANSTLSADNAESNYTMTCNIKSAAEALLGLIQN